MNELIQVIARWGNSSQATFLVFLAILASTVAITVPVCAMRYFVILFRGWPESDDYCDCEDE